MEELWRFTNAKYQYLGFIGTRENECYFKYKFRVHFSDDI